MSENQIDVLVIGAGVIGLAIARKLAIEGKEVIVIEEKNQFGSITSSRNSGVIHAGVYYDKGSLKSKFCSEGNRAMYQYCNERSIPHKNMGKFIVATSNNEVEKLEQIYNQANETQVLGIEKVSGAFINSEEPLVHCVEGLHVPSSGIVDASALMRSYLGDLEDNGGFVSFNSKFESSERIDNDFLTHVLQDNEKIKIKSRILINSAGLLAEEVAKKQDFLNQESIPKTYYAKGSYFETGKKMAIKKLIYPVPNEASLGLHLGFDIGMAVRFGPDLEWVDEIDYKVDEIKKIKFYEDIKKYIPSFDISLLKPGYSGVRPKLKDKGQGKSDFMIQGYKDHKINNLVNLFGMESPGLTSSLMIADYVNELVN